ncbi:MAG: tRNA (adenosine(37)-N6)-dimethylallyltransferase MiaA, partial [Cyclobacteriaceae bacterium]|nr:tRNA (adenosine(37)-N6)-dimethylallyltransferase MiaA [Cyclobacteriaceae bacterium]
GLNRERDELYERIDQRMDQMIARGLFKEAQKLMNYEDLVPLQTVGYQEVFDYLKGKYQKQEAVRLLKRNSRRYAKRQLTWFRKDQQYRWFHPDEFQAILHYLENG